MDRFDHVSWGEVIRRAVEEKVCEEGIKWALNVMAETSRKARLRSL